MMDKSEKKSLHNCAFTKVKEVISFPDSQSLALPWLFCRTMAFSPACVAALLGAVFGVWLFLPLSDSEETPHGRVGVCTPVCRSGGQMRNLEVQEELISYGTNITVTRRQKAAKYMTFLSFFSSMYCAKGWFLLAALVKWEPMR